MSTRSLPTNMHIYPNRPAGKLTPQHRSRVNELLVRNGFDGNGRFISPGRAIADLATVLDGWGLELADTPSFLPSDQGRETFRIALTNPSDRFSPSEIANSMLVFSWYKHGDDRYEVLAYLS